MTRIVKRVEKDKLSRLNYFKSDVLFNSIEKNRRRNNLQKALEISGKYRGKKAKIVFACQDGVKKVEAKIISIKKSKVLLKGIHSLPVRSIIGVDVI